MCRTFFRRFFRRLEFQLYSIYLILNKDLFYFDGMYKGRLNPNLRISDGLFKNKIFRLF